MSSEDKDAEAAGGEITESSANEIDVAEPDKVSLTKSDGDESTETELPGAEVQEKNGRKGSGLLVAAALIAVLLLGSIGAAVWVYFGVYRDDQQAFGLNPFKVGSVDGRIQERQKEVRDAASGGTVALLSYAPETLDKDLANAKAHLTGEFLKYYSQFTDQIVAPAAKQKGVKTEATVARAAVSELHPDNAVVLVFVNQVTTSKDRPDPALATSSVVVKLTKTDGRWLISEFNPV
jgi:Mce-associated membrane protein